MRALLCTGRLDTFSGSELIIIELGQELARKGFDVHVFAYHVSETLEEVVREVGITLKTCNAIDLGAYDLIYTQQNTLARLLNEAAVRHFCEIGFPYIIYAHLSPYVEIEAPLSRLESEVATHIIANSLETKRALASYGTAYQNAIVVPNPSLDAYISAEEVSTLRRILIVSNHCPDEVLEARDLLIEAGYEVKHIGEGGTLAAMNPQILHNYDAVITIGKTVQMAILANRRVYCYDHFGGPGWLTDDNFEEAAAFNFSGRDMPVKKTATEIFNDMKRFTPELPQFYRKHKRFLIRFWVALLLRDLKQSQRRLFDDHERLRSFARLDRCMSVVCAQAFENHHFLHYVLPVQTRLITDRDGWIADRDNWIADRDGWIADRDKWILDRDKWIRERDDLIRHLQLQIKDRDLMVQRREALIKAYRARLTGLAPIKRCLLQFFYRCRAKSRRWIKFDPTKHF